MRVVSNMFLIAFSSLLNHNDKRHENHHNTFMNNNSSVKSAAKSGGGVKLPRGLWVGKVPRKGRVKRDLALVPAGKRPWDVWPEDYQEYYYFRVIKEGLSDMQRSCETMDYAEAVRRAKVEFELALAAKWDKRAKGLVDLGGKRKVCLLGAVFEAYMRGPKMAKESQRIVQSARLVVAMAKGWRVEGVQLTEHSDLARRIDALPADVLGRDTVRAYFAVCQGGVYAPTKVARENITINKRLRMARQLFTRRAMELCYDGVALPDVEGFLKFPGLPEESIDLEEESIAPEDYLRMLSAAEWLEGSMLSAERELALINRMLRELGLRNSELLAARADWLVRDARSGRWFLDVRNRPEQGYKIKGVDPGKLPVSDALLALMGPRMVWDIRTREARYLIMPEGLPTHRFDVINREHNAWLKPLVGEIRSGKGNHRLRKYVATMLAEQYGVAVAAQYLRHRGEAVTLKHYIARRKERLPVVDTALLKSWNSEVEIRN